jgi:hypothetical protein
MEDHILHIHQLPLLNGLLGGTIAILGEREIIHVLSTNGTITWHGSDCKAM